MSTDLLTAEEATKLTQESINNMYNTDMDGIFIEYVQPKIEEAANKGQFRVAIDIGKDGLYAGVYAADIAEFVDKLGYNAGISKLKLIIIWEP